MKFGYSYKTSDGVRHEDVYSAASKEEVFASLRKVGIRPIKVWVIENKTARLRNIIIGCAVVAVIAVTLVILSLKAGTSGESDKGEESLTQSKVKTIEEEARSQIYGDPGILQACESRNWSNVFEDPGELFLARHAQPGISVKMKGNAWRMEVANALKASTSHIVIHSSDCAEIAKMKRMVNGMKSELAQYIADGGTVEQYIEEVIERQSIEEKIVINFKSEFEKLEKEATKDNQDEIIKQWNTKNTVLRQMGLRTVLIPESLDL